MNAQDREAIGELDKRLSGLETSLTEIRDALLGTEMRPEGFIQQQASIERRLMRLEKIADRSKWFLIGALLLSAKNVYELIVLFI